MPLSPQLLPRLRSCAPVLACLLLLAGCGGAAQPAAAPGAGGAAVPVTTATVQPRAWNDSIAALGTVNARESVTVTAKVSETVQRVHFDSGDRVAAGDVLVTLSGNQQQAALRAAEAAATEAEQQYVRGNELVGQQLIARASIDTLRATRDSARANVAEMRADIGDRTIRAPFAGVLGLSTVTAGTLVNPGGIIATLDDIDVVRVDFPIPERYLSVLRPGVPITATIDAYGDETFSGRIALIDTRVNEQTRSVTARAEIPNPGGRIRPGMAVRVAVQQGQRTSIAAPEAAVQYEGEGAFVYRIARGENGSTAPRVEVEAGAVEGGFVEILSGLNAGDRIVASGLNRIQPNAPVTVAGAGNAGGIRQGAAAAPQGAAR